jgi:hypothetical protein
MTTLLDLLIDHINGTSGMSNQMLTGSLEGEYARLTSKEQRQLYAIISKYLTDSDEDVVSTVRFILSKMK